MHFIENISDSLLFSLSSFIDEKVINILDIIEIIQAIYYIMPCQY